MFESFTNYFVPNTKESSQIYRTKIGVFQGLDSIGVNSFLFILKPLSTDSSYENIVLEDEDMSTFKVIGTFECVIE